MKRSNPSPHFFSSPRRRARVRPALSGMVVVLLMAAAAIGQAVAADHNDADLKLPQLAQAPDGAREPDNAVLLPQAVVVQPRPVRFLVSVGLTGGGDSIARAEYLGSYYDHDEGRKIRAGQLLQVSGGVEWRVAPAVTMQASIGFHYDGASAYNGDIDFGRYPLELLAHYALAPQWRLGGGLRYVLSPSLDGSGVARDLDVDFKNALGPVIEAEYLAMPWLGIKARAVFERYKPKDGRGTASGNHVGIFTTFYF